MSVDKRLLELPDGVIDLNAEDNTGENGFQCACYAGRQTIVEMLLDLPEGKINVNNTNIHGRTGLEEALRYGYTSVAETIQTRIMNTSSSDFTE